VATRIRLRRTGKKKQAYYRFVVADSRSPRDGRFIEELGTYAPCQQEEPIKLDFERAAEIRDRIHHLEQVELEYT